MLLKELFMRDLLMFLLLKDFLLKLPSMVLSSKKPEFYCMLLIIQLFCFSIESFAIVLY